jgi:hypothetical protein
MFCAVRFRLAVPLDSATVPRVTLPTLNVMEPVIGPLLATDFVVAVIIATFPIVTGEFDVNDVVVAACPVTSRLPKPDSIPPQVSA